MAAEDLQIRFRHTSGDVGPIPFPDTTSCHAVIEKLLSQWPKEGLLANDAPQSTAELKLILSGKFVDNNKLLRDYRRDMGDPKPDTVVTMHIVVRKAPAGKSQGYGSGKDSMKNCFCVIQ